MKSNDIQIPDIPESEMTPLVKLLVAIISKQAEQIQRAKEQIQGVKEGWIFKGVEAVASLINRKK